MKKRILILGTVLALLMAMLIPGTALAADDTVTCTVSGKLISVEITDGAVAYGVVELGSTQDTTATGVDDTQTATNNGSVAEDFSIMSTNAVGTTDWTLAGTAGSEQYTHSFSINEGSEWTATSGSYVSLATDVAAGTGSQDFDLQIGMPTATVDYGEHTITVTVMAEEAS